MIDIINERYSCRAFSDRSVSKELVTEVLEAARMAPSACNKQPWTFYVVTNADMRAKILAKSRPAFMQAPVLVVAVGHHQQAWHRPSDGKDHTDVDVSIAVEHICLQATASGLATCWVCSFDTDATRQALNLPDSDEPIALIPLGYAADGVTAPAKTRKDTDEIVRWVD